LKVKDASMAMHYLSAPTWTAMQPSVAEPLMANVLKVKRPSMAMTASMARQTLRDRHRHARTGRRGTTGPEPGQSPVQRQEP
jgi:hypothetical protein